jgi:uncharacterized Rmd1/YagE family protein
MSETSPLLSRESGNGPSPIPKVTRSVTFNPQVSTASPPSRNRPGFPSSAATSTGSIPSAQNLLRDGSQPMLSALNSKLRRRNSSGAPLQLPAAPGVKIGPQRTSVRTQKLKLLPNPELGDDGPDEESGKDVYSQFTRIKDPTARRDAARLGKDDRDKLPRVTAYCTASSYRLDELMRFLKGRSKTKSAHPKLFDECIYTPYQYRKDGEGINRRRGSASEQAEVLSQPQRRFSDSAIEVSENAERRREDLIDLQGDAEAGKFAPANTAEDTAVDEATATTNEALADRTMTPDFDTSVHIPEVFLFEYGVVVIWGMTVKEEQRFLKEISKFEQEKLGKDDVQTEEFNFYYTREYQARIYNDFISLREKRNYMTKLAISHALAQSTKVSCNTQDVKASRHQLLTRPPTDIPLRRPRRRNNHNDRHNPRHYRPHRPHQPHPSRNQHANRRALHPPHQHPLAGLRPRRPRTHVGRTSARTRLPGRQKLPGNGPESRLVDGEAGRHCGSLASAERPIDTYSW